MDSGYHGAVGALLQVMNPHGLRLFKDARIVQLVFHRMSNGTEQTNNDFTGLKGFDNKGTALLQYLIQLNPRNA
jgi:dUTP pyrophosphatase